VVTDSKVIEHQPALDFAVDRLNVFASLRTPRDVWLVGDGDQHVTRTTQSLERPYGAVRDDQILDRPGRERAAISEYRSVQDAISVEEHRMAATLP
jgi:hypothetical protein